MTEKIIRIITEILEVKEGTITENTLISDVEEWDSLAQVMIIGELEARLHLSIALEDAMEVESVPDLIKLCSRSEKK